MMRRHRWQKLFESLLKFFLVVNVGDIIFNNNFICCSVVRVIRECFFEYFRDPRETIWVYLKLLLANNKGPITPHAKTKMNKNPQTNSSSQLPRPKFTCNLLKIRPPPQKKTGSSAILGGYAAVLSKAWMNRRVFPDPPTYYRPLLRILIYLLQLQSQKSTTDNKKTTIRKDNKYIFLLYYDP